MIRRAVGVWCALFVWVDIGAWLVLRGDGGGGGG